MPDLVFTRRFSMGHRLIHGASESCALPHGHNEFITVRLKPTSPSRLDGSANMPVSFQKAKQTWHRFVDERLDHALQLAGDDPLLAWFKTHEPTRAARIVVTPGDPTTELMTCLLMAKINAFLVAEGGVLYCSELSIEETPTNTVSFAGDPADFIPNTDIGQAYWWNRADMSIAD
ncbi:6-pyruvoyl trahydropterin synthase family protein [Acetobacter okinawensis]|uniref:6-pyruvoyl trahydropterin synthase family protein n=1 Tax=Acetobacter okinawensis TaxID=1076594 RepID=UPI00046EEC68|nr:6-carboxytetrahydropterin synthase [Acetobacter okinawensis]MBS0964962.1 6-carboxytetrahydropterin synthase [Acetobacter okinawensis]MBS0987623.1 6-carboxytetrahydropterin synthase [Acetobacter okinawensis]MCP1211768.1 6-carboxytetrahydropterin synthase [Acetobacter okinawensis]